MKIFFIEMVQDLYTKIMLVIWSTTFFRTFHKKMKIRRSKKSIFDFYSSKISQMTSKNELLNQFFQITGIDTQRKSCSSWKMLFENGVDHVVSWFPHRPLNRAKMSKIFNFKANFGNFFEHQNLFFWKFFLFFIKLMVWSFDICV